MRKKKNKNVDQIFEDLFGNYEPTEEELEEQRKYKEEQERRNKELQEEFNKLAKEELKNHPQEYEALAILQEKKQALYFKDKDGEIHKAYYVLTLLDNSEESYFWEVGLFTIAGIPRVTAQVTNLPEKKEMFEHFPGINYFPQIFLLEDYGKTWAESEEKLER